MGEAALVPSSVIRNRGFMAACLTILFLSAVFFSAILYVPQLMEKILGYSALKAGVGMLPMLGTFGLVAFLSGRLTDRVGMRRVILAGTTLLAVGPLLLSFFEADSEYWQLVPGLVATGVGAGLFYPTVTTAAVGMLDESQSSLAGGIAYMFQVAGGAVGLGLCTTLFTIRSEDEIITAASAAGLSMSDQQAAVIHGVLAGTEPGAGCVLRLLDLGRRPCPRGGRGLVRRRRPVQLPGRRGDRAGRAGRRDPRCQAAEVKRGSVARGCWRGPIQSLRPA